MVQTGKNRINIISAVLAAGLILLIGLYDGQLSRVLRLDQGPGVMAARWGYWMGHGLVQIGVMLLIMAAGIGFKRPGLKAAAGEGLAAFILSGLGSRALKHLIGRPRPRLWDEGISHFGPTITSGFDSFPSGHASTSIALALVFSYRYPRWTPLFMTGAAFVAAARIISGSHFPLDVLGGVAVGLGAGCLVVLYSEKAAGADPAVSWCNN